jgi:molybdate transport system substrate-binding protein
MFVQTRLGRAGLWVALIACVVALSAPSAFAAKSKVTVYVPCGMELPFMAAKRAFEADNKDVTAEIELDNADILVKRIAEKGERPDIVISPGTVEMTELIGGGYVAQNDVKYFGRYELVLFVPRDNPAKVETFEDLTKPDVKVVALANPKQNSVGRYTKQALEKLGLWSKVEPKLVLTDHPIDAYKSVAQVRAQASFAYRTCPLQSAPEKLEYAKVRIIKSVPMDLYDPAYATIGILKTTKDRALADKFVAFVMSDKGQKLLSENGVPLMTELRIFVPCGMVTPLMTLKSLYMAKHSDLSLQIEFDRIDPLVERVLKGQAAPDVLLSTGQVEMDMLVKNGHVEKTAVVPVGRFQLALCANAARKDDVKSLQDLAKPEVKSIALTNTETNSVGMQSRKALEKAGLWDKVKDKITIMPATKDCYAAVASGKTDASFGYLGCPISIDKEKSEYSKVVAVQTLADETFGGAVALAAVLKDSKHPKEATDFVTFLSTPEARGLLSKIGILAMSQPGTQ